MKRVSLFITSLSSGGAEHQLVQLADFLSERGYIVSIVTFADMSDHYKAKDDVKRVRLAVGKNRILKIISIFFYFLTVKTDVVISFGQRTNLMCLIPLFFRRGVNVICGERNLTIGKPSRTEKLLFGFLYKRANWIVPNSHSQEKHIIGSNRSLEPRVKAITNYTDINKYQYLGYHNNTPMLVTLFCRYNKQKNYENFAKAVKLFQEKHKNKVLFVWYGDKYIKDTTFNPDYLKFSEIIKKYDIENVLKLEGKTDQVAQKMEDSDAVCLPSLFEGFSNTLSEAICCGKIVIASDVSDNSVMVHDGENGFLFDPYNVDDMVCTFEKFMNLSFEQRCKMSEKSRKLAERLFSKEQFVNSYIKLIETLR